MPRYNGTLSNSKLDNYDACPHAFQLSFIERKADMGEAKPREMGSLAHDWCEAYVGHCVAIGLVRDEDEAERMAKAIFDRREQGALTEQDRDEFTFITRRFVRTHALHFPGPKPLVEVNLAIDQRHRAVDFDHPKAHFRARLDLLHIHEGRAVVVDYSTSWLVQPDKAMQLKRYAYMVTRHRQDVEEVHVYIDNIRLGVKSGPVKFFVEDLAPFGEQLESEISRVREDRAFSATPGNACYQCGVAYACRAKLADIGSIDSRESAEAAARKIALDEARLSIAKKALKGWTKEHGPLLVDDEEWGVHHSPRRSYDLATRVPGSYTVECSSCGESTSTESPTMFAEACRLFGMDVTDLLSVNGTKMKKHLEDPAKSAVFKRLMKVTQQGKFGRKKVEKGEPDA